jgi:large subunit ribosomal protein L15
MADASEANVPILSRLKPGIGSNKEKKRLGRGPGSGLGKTSGKGQKGQRARSGGHVALWFEGGQTPLQRRLPKVGFKRPDTDVVVTVNVGKLVAFEKGATVDADLLVMERLVPKRFDVLKILGGGEIDRALTVRAHAFSATAKAAIEKAGGKVELIERRPTGPKNPRPSKKLKRNVAKHAARAAAAAAADK